ncbi:hypothetical protein [Chromobacterium subtsugae]|nr:hypothetical protein [Chromobacterium subtsugae]WSE93295.1 hypothetical protein U6115_08655 [Chromobacterium subtsugae]
MAGAREVAKPLILRLLPANLTPGVRQADIRRRGDAPPWLFQPPENVFFVPRGGGTLFRIQAGAIPPHHP